VELFYFSISHNLLFLSRFFFVHKVIKDIVKIVQVTTVAQS